MRQRAAESDVVIVNHHLLCADAAVRQSAFGEVIPACHYAIVDEAHQLEDVATQYFGIAVSNYRVEELARDASASISAPLFADADRGDGSATTSTACATARALLRRAADAAGAAARHRAARSSVRVDAASLARDARQPLLAGALEARSAIDAARPRSKRR